MLISEQDYESAFNVMHTVLAGIGGNVERGCLFYSLVGSMILKEHYGLTVQPVLGTAAYRLEDEDDALLAFSCEDNGLFVANEKHFHAWIFTDQHFIDFMSPVFRETLIDKGFDTNLPRKGYVRPRADDKANLNELKRPGDFFLNPHPELSKQVFLRNLDNTPISDYAQECCEWFKKAPGKPSDQHTLLSGYSLQLSNIKLQGMW